jgi:ABC-type transport system involved in multi-copper enzyme maturation permease subunit
MTFLSGLWTITAIELRQRVRGVAWYVLLGVFALLVLVVTAILTYAFGSWNDDIGSGAPVYSAIIYFVLLLATLVSPALSGNSINGDRDNGTLATTQVTLVTTPQLVLGKFFAAWISSLVFLAAAVPFILWSFALGGTEPGVVVVSILVLAIELAVVSAIGVGLSGLMRRPLFSVAVTYLLVALLSVGTLIGFSLGGLLLQQRVTVTNSYVDYSDPDQQYDAQGRPIDPVCIDQTTEMTAPRFDLVWWMLAANPYVVLADAVPTTYSRDGGVTDMFGGIKVGVRSAQLAPSYLDGYDECAELASGGGHYESAREIVDRTTPGWLVGLLIHMGMGAGALGGAIAATHAPSRRLSPGSRVA